MTPLFQKQFLWIFLGLAISSSVCFLSAQTKNITILHTNDMHAGFIPHEAYWVQGSSKPLIGGFLELSYAVDSLRRLKKWTLLLDAGDVMTGTPITEYQYKGADGGALFEMMNRIGYDAWEPGNHDFDYSAGNLKKLTHIAAFPTTSANILDTSGLSPVNNKPFILFEVNGLKIGVIGLMSSDFYNLVNKQSSQGILILPPQETMQCIVDSLRSQTDLLIALTHQGYIEDSLLALNTKGIDVIVGGHSHTRLRHPKVVNGVLIVQTGSSCENLGILDLSIRDRRVVEHTGTLLPLWYTSERGTTPLSEFIDSLKTIIDHDYAEVLGILKTDWIRGNSESTIGNFFADAQREAAMADVGFMNSSGIRKNLSAGPITKRDLFEIIPFHNILMKFTLSGKQIRSIVEYAINEHPQIQTSGIRCEWERTLDGGIRFNSFLINGVPLNETALYTCAANDYMMGEAKKYLGIDTPELVPAQQTVLAAVEKIIREKKEITSSIEHRINKFKSLRK